MKTKLVLYSKPRIKRMDKDFFAKTKNVVVPNQSMTLREIIKRFTRREALPIEKNGVYESRFGDLEKLSREDITVRMETAETLRTWREAGEKRLHDEKAAEAQKVLDELVQKEVQKLQQKEPPKEVPKA